MAEIEKRSTATLENLAAEINAEHRAFGTALRTTLKHGIRAGELLSEAKRLSPHGSWLPWLEENFEGAPRTAQEYMKLYRHRDEIQAKAQDSAHLSISGALKELAAPERPDSIPAEEWAILQQVPEDIAQMAASVEGLARLPEAKRRGFVAETAWRSMMAKGRFYLEAMDAMHEAATPERVDDARQAAADLEWWVAQVEWLEGIVRACDWPPGGGMPTAAHDESKRELPLAELYGADCYVLSSGKAEFGYLQSPRERIREFCGPVV